MSICLWPNGIWENIHHDGNAGEEDAGITTLCCIYFLDLSWSHKPHWRQLLQTQTVLHCKLRKCEHSVMKSIYLPINPVLCGNCQNNVPVHFFFHQDSFGLTPRICQVHQSLLKFAHVVSTLTIQPLEYFAWVVNWSSLFLSYRVSLDLQTLFLMGKTRAD